MVSRMQRTLRDRKVISQVLSRLIDTLYPGGQPAPVIPDPTPEEAEAMRSKVERALMAAIPGETSRAIRHLFIC